MRVARGVAAAAACASAGASFARLLPVRATQTGVGDAAGGGLVASSSDTSVFRVFLPDGSNLTYAHSNALFGTPAYGGSIMGQLYYSPVAASRDGCAAITDDAMPEFALLMLDRAGNCSFTQKVLNAQQAGAVGAVIVDDNFLCGVDASVCTPYQCRTCPYYQSAPSCACGLPYMGDDGHGASVSIPSFMIGRTDGEALKAALAAASAGAPGASASLLSSMAWDLPNASGQAELQLWTHADDSAAYALRAALMPYVPYFGATATLEFTPHFYIWDGAAYGCNTNRNCGSQCLAGNDNLYCSMDPDGDLDKGVSGSDVVLENLRQMCAWQVAQAATPASAPDAGIGMAWWRYAQAFVSGCASTPSTFNAACSEFTMQRQQIDVQAVQQCVALSNSTVDPPRGVWVNKLLQQEVDLQAQMAIVDLPAVVVNDVILRGGMTATNVLGAVCAGISPASKPPVCSCLSVDVEALDACVNPPAVQPDSHGIPGWGIALLVGGALGFVAISLFVAYSWQQQRRAMEDVREGYRAFVDGATARALATAAGGGDTEGAALMPQASPVTRAEPVTAAGPTIAVRSSSTPAETRVKQLSRLLKGSSQQPALAGADSLAAGRGAE